MSEMKNRKDFVQRTNEMLKDNWPYLQDKDKEVTFLLNCTLGLIVAIAEDEEIAKNNFKTLFKDNFDRTFLDLLPKRIGFVDSKETVCNDLTVDGAEVNVVVGHKEDLVEKDAPWLLKKIRHGIAHLNIRFENEDEQIKTIRLWNNPIHNKRLRDFEVVFEIKELRDFATKLSDRYFELIPGEPE